MQLSVNRSDLLKAVVLACEAIQSRSPRPDHGAIRLRADSSQLWVEANGGTISVSTPVEQVKVEKAGECMVAEPTKLRDVLKATEDETVELGYSGKMLVVSGIGSEYELTIQDGDLQPIPEIVDPELSIEMSSGVFARLLRLTEFAAGDNAAPDAKYCLAGVKVFIDDGKAEVVGTDAKRLAVAIGEIAHADGDDAGVFIGTRAAGLIQKMLGDPQEMIIICRTKTHSHVTQGKSHVSCLLPESPYCPYKEVIPESTPRVMKTSAAALLDGLARSSLLLSTDSNICRFEFRKSKLTITGRSQEYGRSTVTVPCEYEGAAIDVGFRPNQFVDALKAVGSVDVILGITEANRPALLSAGEGEFRYVVMPSDLPK